LAAAAEGLVVGVDPDYLEAKGNGGSIDHPEVDRLDASPRKRDAEKPVTFRSVKHGDGDLRLRAFLSLSAR
jgi:hypothetical protein